VISEVKRRVSEQHRAVPRSCVHCVAACRTVGCQSPPASPITAHESPLAIEIWYEWLMQAVLAAAASIHCRWHWHRSQVP